MKKIFTKKYWALYGFALLVLVMMGGSVKGQVTLAGWDFNGLTGAGNSPQTPTTIFSNVSIVGLTRGSGLGASSTTTANGVWGSNINNFNTTTIDKASAISTNSFITFSVKANSGYTLNLNQISPYNIQKNTPGPSTGIWQYSSDGTNFTDISSEITWGTSTALAGNPQSLIDLSGINALQNVNASTTITFRCVIWGATTSTTGRWYLNNFQTGNDFIITGSVSPMNYYSKSTGNLNEVANWGTNTDGSGTAPSNFTSADQYFNVRNNASPTIGADWTISGANTKLIIDASISLSIPSTRTIVIGSGTTLENNGTFTLRSDANGTASIGNSAGTITGNITVERYIPANRKFRFLASPVVGSTAAKWRNNGTNTAGIGTQITGNLGAANNFDASTTNAPSAFLYNEALAGSDATVGSGATSDPGWTAFANGNTEALTNGKGFRILIRGDRTISLTGGNATANNTTLSVTGTYPANSVSIATTKTNSNTNSGFNLVGNPYPATIDWNTVTKGADISGTYTTFNPSANSYVEWNGTTGDATRYIASGQAFFVQQTGAIGGITIAEANKVANVAGNFFRNKLADHLKISMKYDSANYDAAYIHFRSDAQNNFDTYDGLKFQNAGVNIASVGTDGKRYNINSLASLNQTTEIPLSVLGSVLTNFELKFDDVQTFKNHELYLIDNYLNKMLALSDGFTYPIELSSDSASVKDGRFKIVFVQKVTGIQNNNKNANAFILYPNPAVNAIHLLNTENIKTNENVVYEIYNQLGALMQQGKLDFTSTKDQTIAIDNIAQGSYFIKLQSNSMQQMIKFIK